MAPHAKVTKMTKKKVGDHYLIGFMSCSSNKNPYPAHLSGPKNCDETGDWPEEGTYYYYYSKSVIVLLTD